MQKLTFYQIAVVAVVAIALALTPAANAAGITYGMTLNHTTSTFSLISENAADHGTVMILNQVIKNTVTGTGSDTVNLEITGFEFFFGGSGYNANTGLPSGGGSNWTYILGAGAYSNSAGTAWTGYNNTPTPGGAVKPHTGDITDDYLTSVTLVNSSSSGYCYVGEILVKGASCDVELLVTAFYGGVLGDTSNTAVWGYAEGEEGTTGNYTNPVNQQMVETIEIDTAPEPSTLMFLGTGLLGLAGLVRRRFVHR
jgi:hypothetical protein